MKTTKNRFASLIEGLYQMEVENEYRESSTRTVTVTFTAENACMFAAIAKRFGKSTSSFGADVFEPIVMELFQALSPEDRVSVGKDTDAELHRYLQSKGITSTENGETPQTWARYAEFLNQREKEAK